MTVVNQSLLLVLPVAFRRSPDGTLLVEKQAANGLERWAENFQYLMVAAPLQTYEASDPSSTVEYVDVDRLACRFRLELIPLPWAYKLRVFIKSYRLVRQLLANKIRTCQYLCFAIGGLVGDWATVAALEAIHQRKPFSIWTDRVEHQVTKSFYQDYQGIRRIYHFLKDHLWVSPLMQQLERHVISYCQLGLFHGLDCFTTYSPYCSNAHLVHDIHLKSSDRISQHQLTQKLHRLHTKDKLQILYVGRAAAMKGPLDWIEVMAKLHARGIAFEATWVRDGPLLSAMRQEVVRLNLEHLVHIPGYISNRLHLLEMLRNSDLFVFCHKTPESPRCLIESLMSASPIVGYGSPYAQDLVGNLADRLLVPCHQITDLVDRIVTFYSQRHHLAEVIQSCYQLGAEYSDEAVFARRSRLIKRYLGQQPPTDHRTRPQSPWAPINVAHLRG